jgi:signal transduction histidine kinase
LRSLGYIAILIVAVAAILGASTGEVSRKRRQLLDELSAAQSAQADNAARELGARLEALAHDTSIVTSLVESTRRSGSLGAAAQDRVILSAFEALVAVVPHYRTIALYGADGTASVTAIDPTEDHETIAPALFELGRGLAHRAAREARSVLEGPAAPAPARGRFFYLFAAQAGTGETVVVTSDAGMFLHATLPPARADARYFVVDPQRVVWSSCEETARCRPGRGAETALLAGGGPVPRARWLTAADASRVGLAPSSALLAAATVNATGGAWTVAIASSAALISERQNALLGQLIITSLAAALAVVAVGVFILRQQRRAAALEERLHSAQELATLERQLVRAEKLLTAGVLSAGLAHELGTPISVVRGCAEHLGEMLAGTPATEDLDAIIRQADRIAAIIGQVLEFSRTRTIHVGPVEAAAAIEKTRELLDWKLSSKQVSLEVRVAAGAAPVSADPDQLQQVLVNLIMNACDACDEGGSIVVEVARVGGTGQVRLDIHDDGRGIPEEDLNAVFDPFFTTKKRGEGTGLGLTVAASIVRNHGGAITVSSKPGRGTTFSVFLPAATAEPSAAAAVAEVAGA